MLIPVEIPSLGRQARRLEIGGQHEKYQHLKHMNIFVWLSEYLTWNYSLFCMLLRGGKKQNQTPPPPHPPTRMHTPFITLLGSLEISLGAYFSAYTHCSAIGFGLCLSLNRNIWEEKYSLKIECCLVSCLVSSLPSPVSWEFSCRQVVGVLVLPGAGLPILKCEQSLGLS